MKIVVFILAMFLSFSAYSAVDKTGTVVNVQLWGGVAKTTLCSGENSCTSFWVSIADAKGQSVLSMWLAAKLSGNKVYIQGYEPSNENHPYNGASKFYGMTLK